MASMRRLEQVEIPAGGTVSFAPGGKHFMLFGKPPLPRAGENVSLKLNFADGGVLELSVPVRKPQ
jgi:copper(I)-binding protein